MVISTPRTPHSDAPASLARALTVLRLGLELLNQPALTDRPADLDALTDAIATATLQILDRHQPLPLW